MQDDKWLDHPLDDSDDGKKSHQQTLWEFESDMQARDSKTALFVHGHPKRSVVFAFEPADATYFQISVTPPPVSTPDEQDAPSQQCAAPGRLHHPV